MKQMEAILSVSTGRFVTVISEIMCPSCLKVQFPWRRGGWAAEPNSFGELWPGLMLRSPLHVCGCEEPEIMLFASCRHVVGTAISDEVVLIIWVDDIIALMVGKQALEGSGSYLLWQMCGRGAVLPEWHRGRQWCCWGAEEGWGSWHRNLVVCEWGPMCVKIWLAQQFEMQSGGKQGKCGEVYGGLALSVWGRDPGAVCRGCKWERGVWRADPEGHKWQLE